MDLDNQERVLIKQTQFANASELILLIQEVQLEMGLSRFRGEAL